MRNEKEVLDLILRVAQADERIRAVSMEGSRANPAAPRDVWMDYDVTFYVADFAPFYNNLEWATANFGKPLLIQMPENLRGAEDDGSFIYLMIFPDGVRIDLNFADGYIDDGEPSITLLDKDDGKGLRPFIPRHDDKIWHIKPPTELDFYSCFNNFWWCLNNVAKGIARDELPYVMNMLQYEVRGNFEEMLEWYIGTEHGFNISAGKNGKYFKKYLPPEIYARYAATFSGADYADIWRAIFVMCDLFREVALAVAAHFSFEYKQEDEDGSREYLKMFTHGKPTKPHSPS